MQIFRKFFFGSSGPSSAPYNTKAWRIAPGFYHRGPCPLLIENLSRE
jgi:hypothetical protein